VVVIVPLYRAHRRARARAVGVPDD
jgi:hypothetical protein